MKNNAIVGILRYDLVSISLGNILTYLNELVYCAQLNNLNEVYLIVIGIELPGVIREITARSVFKINYHFFDSKQDFEKRFSLFRYRIVPQHILSNELSTYIYDYDSFDRIKGIYLVSGIKPHFFLLQEIQGEAIPGLNLSDPFVSVHLKQTKGVGGRGESCANLKIWLEVFRHFSVEKKDVRFVLVGHDPVIEEIQNLHNVTMASQYGHLQLWQHLYLIQKSRAFLGMSSGLCQMAIFSELPYLIFKNPDHHYEEMHKIISNNKLFPFSSQLQQLHQEYESFDRVVHFINSLA